MTSGPIGGTVYASSNYLNLVNQVLVQVNEVELTELTFADARGVHAAAKRGVLHAIQQINTKKVQWPFNNLVGFQVLTPGENIYSWPDNWKDVDWDTFYIEKDDTLSTGTHRLDFVSKDEYYRTEKDVDLDSLPDGRGRPDWVFEDHGGGYGVTPTPDQAYMLVFYYSVDDTRVSAFDDETSIPSLYDWVIVAGALIEMYMFYDNMARAELQTRTFNDAMDVMAHNLIPRSPSATVRTVNQGGGAKYSRHSMSGYVRG
jgi:hypothetical protein